MEKAIEKVIEELEKLAMKERYGEGEASILGDCQRELKRGFEPEKFVDNFEGFAKWMKVMDTMENLGSLMIDYWPLEKQGETYSYIREKLRWIIDCLRTL